MPGVGYDDIARRGPGTGKLVGADDRAHHVIASLDDRRRQVAHPVQVVEQLAGGEEAIVREIVRLEPGETQRPVRKMAHQIRIGQQGRATALVGAPGARERQVDARIRVEQAAPVGGQQVGALAFRDHLGESLPGLRKDIAQRTEEPFDLAAAP